MSEIKSNNSKVIAVFGIGAKLTAAYTATTVTYSDKTTLLTFDLKGEGNPVTKSGVYDVTIVSETEMVSTLAPVQPAVAKESKAKPAESQSPAFGYNSKPSR